MVSKAAGSGILELRLPGGRAAAVSGDGSSAGDPNSGPAPVLMPGPHPHVPSHPMG